MRVMMAALVTVLCVAACVAACRKTPAGTAEQPSVPSQGPAQGGMKAYIDPETGKLTDHPPPGAEPMPGDVLTPTTVIEKPAPGGGTELELQGRKKDDSGR